MKSIPRGLRGISRNELSQKSWKSPQKFKTNVKKNEKKNFSIEFILQSPKYSVIIPKIDRLSWKTEWKTEKSRQIAENCPIFSISRSSANFGEESRSRGVIKSIPRGIEEWKKVRDLEDRGTRNSSCHPYLRFQSRFFWSHFFGEKLKINLKIDYGDQLWRAI